MCRHCKVGHRDYAYLLNKRQSKHIKSTPSANLRQRQNFSQKWSRIRIWIFGLIQIRISVGSVLKCCGCVILSASVISPSMVQIGRWLYEKRYKSPKSPILQCWRKWKKWSGIHTLTRITAWSQSFLEGHALPMPAKFRRRPFSRSSSYPVYRMTHRTTERPHRPNLRLVVKRNCFELYFFISSTCCWNF